MQNLLNKYLHHYPTDLLGTYGTHTVRYRGIHEDAGKGGTHIHLWKNLTPSTNSGNLMYKPLYYSGVLMFKPFLRPLSDLVKEIDLGEGLEIPIKNIFYGYRKGLELKMSFDKEGGLNEMWLDYPEGRGDYVNECSMTREDWDYLYANHFDVGGLIDKELAHDINNKL